jgi:hypothetical protein
VLRLLAAKVLAFAAADLVLSLLISAAVSILGFAILSLRDLPTPAIGELLAQVGRSALADAVALLSERYGQYVECRPAGPVLAVAVSRWSGWRAATGG